MPGRDWDLGTLSPLLSICMSTEFKTPFIRNYLFVCLFLILSLRSAKDKRSVQTGKSYLTKGLEIASLSIGSF